MCAQIKYLAMMHNNTRTTTLKVRLTSNVGVNMKNKFLFCFLCTLFFGISQSYAQDYRIAYSADGNQHDADDWHASPLVLAMLAEAGLKDRLVHFDYNNHLGIHEVNGMGDTHETNVLGAVQNYAYDPNIFYNDENDVTGAVASIAAAVDASSPSSPLYMVCAGPMEVCYRGIDAGDNTKEEFVTIVSHSNWNDKHADMPEMTRTWTDMVADFNVKVARISDQNETAFKSMPAEWEWLKQRNHGQWLYDAVATDKKAGDASDAGMVYYVMTDEVLGGQHALMRDIQNTFDGNLVPIEEPLANTNAFVCSRDYEDVNGYVIMETENTWSPLDLWITKTDVANFTGSGHLEFTGNQQASGPPKSPLQYVFKINQGGLYRLIIRARKRLDGAPSDQSNDAYARLQGDYDESPNAGENHNDDGNIFALRRNVKFFGGAANGWGWAKQLDLGGHHNKRNAVYDLKAGETYTLVISGRSKNFNMDRIVLFNTAQHTIAQAQASQSISETTCTGGPVNDKPTVAITSPGNNDVFAAGDDISISVDASDSDGTVEQVEIFANGESIAVDTTAPYGTTINNAAAGSLNLTATATDNDGASANSSAVAIEVVGVIGVPGTVQAEDFINQSGVQTEPTSDTGGGLNIGFIENGDFTEYSINVAETATYDIDCRVASATNGGSIDIQADGLNVGSISVGNTTGWQAWENESTLVELNAGMQTLRLNFTGGTSFLFNVNYCDFTKVIINNDPTASFTFNAENLNVSFDGSASSDPDNDTLSYIWDFGDNNNGAGVSPSHSYAAAGTYAVTLTVNDGKGGTDSVSQNVTVSEPAQKPAAPTGLTTTPACDQVSLSWTDNSNNEDNFEVRRKLAGQPNSTAITLDLLPANTTSYVDPTAEESTNYLYKVRSVNSAGIGATVWVVANTTACSSAAITVNNTVANCNPSGNTRNIVNFSVSGTFNNVTTNKGTLIDQGGGNYKNRHINAPFGSSQNYKITVKNAGAVVATKTVTVVTVSSCN